MVGGDDYEYVDGLGGLKLRLTSGISDYRRDLEFCGICVCAGDPGDAVGSFERISWVSAAAVTDRVLRCWRC